MHAIKFYDHLYRTNQFSVSRNISFIFSRAINSFKVFIFFSFELSSHSLIFVFRLMLLFNKWNSLCLSFQKFFNLKDFLVLQKILHQIFYLIYFQSIREFLEKYIFFFLFCEINFLISFLTFGCIIFSSLFISFL